MDGVASPAGATNAEAAGAAGRAAELTTCAAGGAQRQQEAPTVPPRDCIRLRECSAYNLVCAKSRQAKGACPRKGVCGRGGAQQGNTLGVHGTIAWCIWSWGSKRSFVATVASRASPLGRWLPLCNPGSLPYLCLLFLLCPGGCPTSRLINA